MAALPASTVYAAVIVGPQGAPLQTFSSRPETSDGWATVSVSGGSSSHQTVAALDATVQTLDAAGIGSQVGQSGTWPPSRNALSRWNSTGQVLQTHPTGNAATVLMATLRNATGGNVDNLHLHYDFGSWHENEYEHVYGHRTFYSRTGQPGTWELIPEFSNFSQTAVAGATRLQAQLNLGTWADGDPLYIVWADDNGPGHGGSAIGPEGAYTINNFGAGPAPPVLALQVGTEGLPTQTFDTKPSPLFWSTASVSGGSTSHSTAADLDATVQDVSAGFVTTELGQSATWRPSNHGLARWNSTSELLQTRPTGVAATLLVATLENATDDHVDNLHVHYDFGTWHLETEDVEGHRTFFSLTGDPGTWQLIPEFSNFLPAVVEGERRLTAALDLAAHGSWAPGDPLYLLWADDNARGADSGYTINNFGIGLTAPSPLAVSGVSIGPDGILQAFNARPTPEEGWATVAVPGGSSTHLSAAALDTTVQSLDAQLIDTQVGQSGTWTPSTNALARWNSTGHMMQTRPTGVAATVLMATLENETGADVDGLHVWYDFGSWGLQDENVDNHRVFYSLTGQQGSWQLIPEFSDFPQVTEAGTVRLHTELNLGSWAPGDPLYLLWADDNAQGADTAYTINNFGVSTREPIWPEVTGNIVQTMSAPADTNHTDYFANWIVGTDNQSTDRIELTGGHTFEAGSLRLFARDGGSTSPHLVSVSGENTWTGPVTIGETDGTLGIIESAAGSRLTLTGDVYSSDHVNNRALWLGGDGDGLLAGDIAANIRDLRKYGSGTWTLTGDLGHAGTTTVDDGTLHIHHSGVLSLRGGTAGSGAVVQTGGHLLQLANTSNSFTGDWYIRDGSTLQVTTQSRLPRHLTFDGGALEFTGSSTSLSSSRHFYVEDGGGLITLNNNVTIDHNNLHGTGTLALADSGGSYLRIEGSSMSNFNGTWHLLEGGYLRVRSNTRIGGNDSSVLFDGGRLRIDRDTTLTGNKYFQVTDAGGTLDIRNEFTLGTANQVRGTGTLTKVSDGELRIQASQPNFTGTWELRDGTVRIYNSADRLGGPGSNVLFNGGTMRISASGWTLGHTQYFTVGDSGGTLRMGGYAVTLGADDQLRGSGTLTLSHDGTLVLSSDHSFAGTLTGASAVYLDSPLALPHATVDLARGGIEFGAPDAYTLGGLGGGTDVNVVLENAAHQPVALTVGNNDRSTVFAGELSGDGSLTKIGAGTLTLTGNTTYTGPTTVLGGRLEVLGPAAGPNGSADVLLASAGMEFHAGAASIVRRVAPGESFAGIGSQTLGDDGLPGFQTQADLLAGANNGSGDLDVGMTWRVFDLENERQHLLPAHRPVSDVLWLDGMAEGAGAVGETDPYVLQMSYDASLVTPVLERGLHLAWFDGEQELWVNAVEGNLGLGPEAVHRHMGGWDAFDTLFDASNDLAAHLGSWGVDTENAVAWAVLNHNSQFSVMVPEPTTMLMALAALVLLLCLRRRKA